MRTVTGLFDSYTDAESAVSQLRSLGIDHDEISVVSNNSDSRHKIDADDNDVAEDAGKGAGIGAVLGGTGGLLTGLGIMAIPGVGPVVAAGWLAAALAGAATGAVVGGAAGGLIGALTDAGVDERDAHVYAEGVRRGGTLVTARVPDTLIGAAEDILAKSPRVDVAARRNAYLEGGWKSFDPTLDPYTPAEVEQERRRYDRSTGI
ncbi:putative membrane protein [Rhizobium sp. BK619]|uniref:general stress protein n=1 Tax=Rhizobium sp. BK619 TaxID=2586989 RepID=UPI0016139E05|nr:general stress protein [Rhizobium sp. BK619]MBB3644346.1 putative membrane protein [Rhizobium sp. BK619]